MDEVEKFYIDDFYNEILHEITMHSPTKQQKYKMFYKAVNLLMKKVRGKEDSQTLISGLVYLMGVFNDRPVDRFFIEKPLSPEKKQEFIEILRNEFVPN